ncbi:MAG: ABC transporter substrate-binding protein [Lachnospiraceae bacterium]|nr:ABC transporter substrate-binding protein [Lachnospiraceae bacterium]
MNRLKNNLVVVALCLLCLIVMAVFYISGGFLGKSRSEETDNNDHLIMVGISQLGSESVWRTANTESVQQALSKENGYFPIFNNARQNQENQIKAIRGYISQKVDYIVFAPVTETGWDTVLMEAKNAGIPVILMDRTVDVEDDSLYVTRVGSDMHEEGKKAGMWLEEELRDKGRFDEDINIVILTGNKGSSAEIGRTGGFAEIKNKHKNWHVLEEVDADFTTSKGKEEMRRLLAKYSDIDVVVSQNDDMTFGALEAIRDAGKTTGDGGDIVIISFDSCKEALELVRDGIINVDIECNPLQGQYISDVIKALERGEEIRKEYIVDENVFTKSNVEGYINDRTY